MTISRADLDGAAFVLRAATASPHRINSPEKPASPLVCPFRILACALVTSGGCTSHFARTLAQS